MERFTVTLQTIRPVFCRGAESEAAELRAPSLKGLLRWWYRAWHPLAIGEPLDGPWLESRIFGGTEKHIGQCPFLLRVECQEEPQIVTWSRPAEQGLGYLSFSFRSIGGIGHRAIAEGAEFSAIHNFPRTIENADDAAQRLAVAKGLVVSWWLLGHFGGLGARSRRGFGSLAITKWEWPGREELLQALPLAYAAHDMTAWKESMRGGLKTLMDWRAGAQWPRLYPHPHIGADMRLLMQVQAAWPNAKAAHDAAGLSLSEGRRKFASYGALDGRVTFGLPFKGEKPASWRREPFEIGSDIHPSPLHLHVAAFNQGGSYGLTWLRLSGPVPGRGEYRLKRYGQTIREEAPNALARFMTDLENEKKAVRGWPP